MKTWRCRVSLRSIVKVVAAFEMAICIVAIIPLTLVMLDVCFEGELGVFIEYALGVPRSIQLSIWLACWTLILMKFLLEVTLYRGANKKNHEAAQIWLTVTSGILITCYIWSLLSLNMVRTLRGCLTVMAADVLIGLYKGFEIIVVYKFMQNIKKNDRLQLFTTRATAPISITDFNFGHHELDTGGTEYSVNEHESGRTEGQIPHMCKCHV